MNNINAYTLLPTPLDRKYSELGAPDIVNVLMAILASSGGGAAGFGPTDSNNLQNVSVNTGNALPFLGAITTNTSNTASFTRSTGEQVAKLNYQNALGLEQNQTRQLSTSPNGAVCPQVQAIDAGGTGNKGRASTTVFTIARLDSGVAPSVNIQGSVDGNIYTTIGVFDLQTLQNVPATTSLDVTKQGQSFSAPTSFNFYRFILKNTSGLSNAIVIFSQN